jgi:hypothetical protein
VSSGSLPLPSLRRSDAPRTLGLWSMIVGVLGILGEVRLLIGTPVSDKIVAAATAHPEALAQYTADTRAASLPTYVAALAMAIALTWIGLGQRRYRRWAVRASLRWAALAVLLLVANTLMIVFVHRAIHDRFVAAVGEAAYPYHFPFFVLAIGIGLQGAFVFWTVRTFRKPEVVAVMDQPPLPPPHLPAATVVSSS